MKDSLDIDNLKKEWISISILIYVEEKYKHTHPLWNSMRNSIKKFGIF